MKNTNVTYLFFGSADSVDYDVVFLIDAMPETILEKLTLSNSLKEQLAEEYQDKVINANLAVCSNGCIVSVYKGTADELNNSVLATYDLHHQDFGNEITKTLKRDVHLKLIRSLRMLLSFVSKTEFRTVVKAALKGDVHLKVKTLAEINLLQLNDFGKGTDATGLKKMMAFQLGQTLALASGTELYTKKEIMAFFPELKPFLLREPETNMEVIQTYVNQLVAVLKEEIPKMKNTEEYAYQSDRVN
ncbi:hypothetical protein NAT51_02955 [Flavobacterium amniphilum]|uniref:hypothetical protein n=1 Tax=Flavobacterium amniphilum TaxID=1834035 RepID=UPI002029EC93|nr:hypothetical protein [Flavobacterium amniphilum]MCL9804464.1 hypothetical protein [Flavobacterium amniphilum]